MNTDQTPPTTDGVAWHISSHSTNGAGQCLEAGPTRDGTSRYAIRDSRNRHHGSLLLSQTAWHTFLHGLKTGEFDT